MNYIKNDKPLVMVTGATGFVGKSLVNFLLTKGISTRRCVREITPYSADPECSFENGDINEFTNWSEALRDVGVVVHTAARVHVMDEKESDPLAAFRRVNVLATVNLARQAVEAGVSRFIYLSSVKVNGESSSFGVPLKASDSSMPVGPYATSKREAEVALLDIASETGLEVVIIRPPLVYGMGVKANFALLIRAIKAGVPLPFGRVFENRRSMVSLTNLVDFIVLCLDSPNAVNQIFMVSDGDDTSTADLIMRIANTIGRNYYLVPVSVSVLEKMALIFGKKDLMGRLTGNLQVDINKNFELLNWKPKASLDKGLILMLCEVTDDNK
jgi:nucleoside-diphosphate-sugar epimerase